MPDYEGQQFDPPAPVARVTIRALDGVRGLPDVAMLIDSGADVTLIPQVCAQRLGLKSEMEASVNLVGIGGTAIAAKAVKAELIFLGRNFRGRFLLIEGDYGILGRNVLNNLSLLLDGPRQNWRQEPSRREEIEHDRRKSSEAYRGR